MRLYLSTKEANYIIRLLAQAKAEEDNMDMMLLKRIAKCLYLQKPHTPENITINLEHLPDEDGR